MLIINRQNLEKIRRESEETQTEILARVVGSVLHYEPYNCVLTVMASDDLPSTDKSKAIEIDVGTLMLRMESAPDLFIRGSTLDLSIAVRGSEWPVYGTGLSRLKDAKVLARPAVMEVLRAVANLEDLPNVFKDTGNVEDNTVTSGSDHGESE